jgi:lysyl-tRNA synthetase class 2
MGKSSFLHIQDGGGRLQVFIKRDDIGEDIYNHFKLLDIGDFVGVEGFVFKTKVNEISINAKNLTVLCKSIRPLPIVKEKEDITFDAFSDKEQRYRNRHLDLIVNTDIRDTFIKRANIIKSIRNYLDDLGFLEVETPVLQPLYGGANARPFTTHHNSLDQNFFLRIADELYLKRLIIGGIDRVYELSKDFRNEGMDRNHNPEFTMLEFYWAYADYEDNMDLVEAMIRDVAKNIGAQKINWGEMTIDLAKPFKRKPIFELLKEATGEDFSNISLKQLRKICIKHNIEVVANANYGQMLDGLMSTLVEPNLIQPTFVIDYPKEISPLAKKHRNGNPNLVERFELFIGTAEFANAFTELNDPIDQRDRFESQEKLVKAGDDEAHPIDENFLQAIECGMPPTAGVGIGIDRLVMLLTENLSIKDVILFPAMRKEE